MAPPGEPRFFQPIAYYNTKRIFARKISSVRACPQIAGKVLGSAARPFHETPLRKSPLSRWITVRTFTGCGTCFEAWTNVKMNKTVFFEASRGFGNTGCFTLQVFYGTET